ncbi:DUF2939 domain-containing protein [Microbulbifer sp.]|uniref:DUF2939 domain-containing protein n=1 Tax=Microbulbifer sp. TaxID=1908541 RepID=UPI003F381E60
MKKGLLISALLLALFAGGYTALPWYTAEQIVRAAEAEDIERLRGYIDFPTLRENLKLRLQQRLRESMGESVPEELSELLTAGANLFIVPILNQLVTPEGIGDLLRGGKNLREFERELYRDSLPDGEPVEPDPREREGDWRLLGWHFVDFNRVAADCGDDNGAQLRLILERQGLHWRLVDIALLDRKEELKWTGI